MSESGINQSDVVARFYADPLGWVRFSFPWKEVGTELEGHVGPDEWAKSMLVDIGRAVRERRFDGVTAVDPIRFAVSSGHGIGKSAFVSWLILWLMSTRVNCKGIVSASTLLQLESKTWPELSKWYKLMVVGRDWFDLNVSKNNLSIRRRGSESLWFMTGVSPNDAKPEAFAGQHNTGSSSVYIFDEASGIADNIYETAYGGLTDGESHMYLFGNPTRKDGEFFRIFRDERIGRVWVRRSVDSRTCRIANKRLLDEWVEQYGEDSDFVRIRVRGEFPSRGETSLFSWEDIQRAVRNGRELLEYRHNSLKHHRPANSFIPHVYSPSEMDALRAGLDVARFGGDGSEVAFRRGRDAVSIPWKSYDAMDSVDLSNIVKVDCDRLGVDGLFVDAIGVGSGVYDQLWRMGGSLQVYDVMGSREPLDKRKYTNKRSEMYFKCSEWLRSEAYLPDDDRLKREMESITFGEMADGRMYILSKVELKKVLGSSPDKLDALTMTFAMEGLNRRKKKSSDTYYSMSPDSGSGGWMGV